MMQYREVNRMKISRIMSGIEYELIQGCDKQKATSMEIDSRKVEPGGIYIAISAITLDRHLFIGNAAVNGAVAAIIDRDQEDYPEGMCVIKVANARKSWATMCANFYDHPEAKLRLYGVTGTNGKTSVTYIMQSILKNAGLIGTVGLSLGDKLIKIPFDTSTTPDPPELMQIFDYMHKNGAKDVIMEVSSHALALHKMEGLHFEVAMFTNLTQDHLDFHGTMENYLAAKAKLFGQCRFGVVNTDDKYSPQIMTIGNPERWITYGIDKKCDIQAVHIEDRADGSAFDVEIDGKMENFYLPVKSRFNIYNALACIGAALVTGISVEQIRNGLASFKGVPGRIQSIPNDKGFEVLVDYAHSPDSLVNIINAVRTFTNGKLVTVFGCGGDKDTDKRPKMGRIAGTLSDHCILTSDNPRSEPPEAIIDQIEEGIKDTDCPYNKFVDRREAIFAGIAMLEPGDALIIAGKGHEDYQIIGSEILHFDDVEVAKEALATLCN